MSQQKKLSILQTLLARVQKRAGAPRPDAPVHPSPAASAVGTALPDDDAAGPEQVPPSAPRVKETAAEAHARSAEERHVGGVRQGQMVSSEVGSEDEAESVVADEDMEIAITISDSPPPPPGVVEDVEIPPAAPVPGFGDAAAVSAAAPSAAEVPVPPRDDLSWPPAAAEPEIERAVSPAPAPLTDHAPVAVRLMVESAPAASPGVPHELVAAAAVPIEVSAQVHAGAPLRGAVGKFIEQSRAFSPRTFGELLQASLGLGGDGPSS
jgi:hypothetical protein